MNLHSIQQSLPRADRGARPVIPVLFALLLAGALTLALVTATTATAWVRSYAKPAQASTAPAATIPIFVYIAPAPDGQSMLVNGIRSEVPGQLFISATGNGGAQREFSYTDVVTYSTVADAYLATIGGLWQQTNIVGALSFTTTEQSSSWIDYKRAYIPAQAQSAIVSPDQIFALSILFTDTFPAETYLAVTTNNGELLGAPPANYTFVGQVYTLRAAGLVYTTTQRMPLVFNYNPTLLGDLAPEALVIMAWNPATLTWQPLTTLLATDRQQVSTSVVTFTTYALMAAPLTGQGTDQQSWQDEFHGWDHVDVSRSHNIDIIRDGSHYEFLTLAYSATQGVALSQPIIPPPPINAWQRIYYTTTMEPPTTTLTIDLLDLNGTPLFTNVANGFDLSTLDVTAYPALRLRANLTATRPGAAPLLDGWRLTWQRPATLTPTPTTTPTATPTPTMTATPIIPSTATPTPTATATRVAAEPSFFIYLPKVHR
ncbi:MAG: hypothetical protein R3C14_24295 [Caldilineaceae bacterium]